MDFYLNLIVLTIRLDFLNWIIFKAFTFIVNLEIYSVITRF